MHEYQTFAKPDPVELEVPAGTVAPGATTTTSTAAATTTITAPPTKDRTTTAKIMVDIDMDDAMDRLGMGIFQYQILLAAGLCFAADAMEVLLLSFLSTILMVEWQLEGHQMDTIISVVFAGAMVGTLILSPLGDKFGRKPMFTITAALITVFGLATAACTSYLPLLFTRFMVGFGVGGLVIPFDTLAEFVPTSHRGTNLLYIEFFWTGGTLLVPVFAWLTLGNVTGGGSWQLFVVLCAIPCLLSTALGILLVPESPRWLLTQGRGEEALAIMRQAAKRNGKDPYDIFPENTRIVTHEKIHEEAGFRELFAPEWLYTTLKLWGAWFGLAFLYYGVIIAVSIVFTVHEVAENGEGSYDFDYSAIFISASAEIFGLLVVLFTIDRYGRIPTQTTAYLMGGGSCLLLTLAAAADSPRYLLLILAFMSRMAMMGSSCTTWVSTSEILSTEIRATGHGAANAVARLGGFFCPYIISDHTPIHWIGIFIFTVSVVTASVSWFLPETAGQSLGEGKERSKQKLLQQSQADSSTQLATGYQII